MGTLLAIRGSDQLRAVGRSLRLAGSPGRGVRSKLRRDLVAAAQPVKAAVQSGARAIPAAGPESTGLRNAIANATQVRVVMGGKNVVVRVWVNPGRMPAGQGSLPALMEGLRTWRHPLFGDTDHWYTQPAHPFVGPVAQTVAVNASQKAALAAINETAAIIGRGI